MLKIYIDGDACSVKEETYKVADRYKMNVVVVSNMALHVPLDSLIEMVVVKGNFDAADDWIIEKVLEDDIVITSDILLADRCLKKNALVLGPKGKEFTEDSIGSAVAARELMSNLRHMGEMRGGPAPMQKKDRSQYLSQLDQIIQRIRKKNSIRS